jgi:hypothetical protein
VAPRVARVHLLRGQAYLRRSRRLSLAHPLSLARQPPLHLPLLEQPPLEGSLARVAAADRDQPLHRAEERQAAGDGCSQAHGKLR